jgi:hypothetical protein
MFCFGTISERDIEDALDKTKAAFYNSITVADKPASLEQCVSALKVAVDTLTRCKRTGSGLLTKLRIST